MVFDKLFSQNSVLESAMQASLTRNQVILSNVANVDTPNYVKKRVDFEESLANALKSSENTGEFDLSKIKPVVRLEHSGFDNRLDKNNVDIETEMVDLYHNSVRYDTMVSGVINNYRKINLVMQLR